MQGHYDTVSKETEQIRLDCEQLLQEQANLVEERKKLQHSLQYFDQADQIARQLR